MTDAPHGCNLRRGRVSLPGQVYFVTMVCKDRRSHFAGFAAARCAVSALHGDAVAVLADTLAFVVMPDHVHWLMLLKEGAGLGETVWRFKVKVSLAIGGRIWQRGFHDHALRRDEDVVTVARYVVANPMRAGLVRKVGDYPHWDAVWV
ncbi:REP-associated tyrosine transposase [Propionivibrio limicola]|uniref:REP-associated tyrosine transposase n=1 Tax=Propionivibrio limicola TaxID=167645 RepID=UPI0012919EBF|nr:transposase [Propionivibrio limicola]